MNEGFIVGALALLGLCLGSFANATVWRLHKKKSITNDRSECEHCHHKLAWYDLIPVLSWLLLRGKCRYCKKPIRAELPLTELTLSLLFILSYLVWPLQVLSFHGGVLFGLWLVALTLLMILFLYDLKWLLLPDRVMFPLIAIGLLITIVRSASAPDPSVVIASSLFGVLILSGLYLVLFIVSRGRWVGFGDVKLGLFLGLALGSWELALLCLFLANLIGCLVVIPGMLAGKLQRSSRVPFGPFLISGFLIAMLFGQSILHWYFAVSGL